MTDAADNEELDALVADLLGPYADIGHCWVNVKGAAAAITALRARVAELEQELQTGREGCMLDLRSCVGRRAEARERDRANAAESQLRQVKADAERMKSAMNLVLKHAGQEIHLGPARLSGLAQGCIACIAHLALDGADKEYFDEALARRNDGTA